jgi:hypothetical protein
MNTKQLFRLFALVSILTLAGGLLFAAPSPEEEAQKSAEQWLALVDAGYYGESWDAAAQYFKNAVPKDHWEHSLNAVRKPLGNLVTRKLTSAKYATSLPGAPDGEYVVLQFETAFQNKMSAIETVTPMLDKDGKWRVSGYYIK